MLTVEKMRTTLTSFDTDVRVTKSGTVYYKGSRVSTHAGSGGLPNFYMERKRFMLHRLVAELYCKRPEGADIVFFKNLDKTDCRAVNLEWISKEECVLRDNRKKKHKRGITSRPCGGWQANISIRKEVIYLGIYAKKEDAYRAYYNSYKALRGVKPW